MYIYIPDILCAKIVYTSRFWVRPKSWRELCALLDFGSDPKVCEKCVHFSISIENSARCSISIEKRAGGQNLS